MLDARRKQRRATAHKKISFHFWRCLPCIHVEFLICPPAPSRAPAEALVTHITPLVWLVFEDTHTHTQCLEVTAVVFTFQIPQRFACVCVCVLYSVRKNRMHLHIATLAGVCVCVAANTVSQQRIHYLFRSLFPLLNYLECSECQHIMLSI